MFTPENLKSYICNYVSACKDAGIHFDKVILFGSYASNTQHEWSDIDLALVSEDFVDMGWDDYNKIATVNIKFVDIEPHIFSTTYFKKGDPFIEEILRTGTEIVQEA